CMEVFSEAESTLRTIIYLARKHKPEHPCEQDAPVSTLPFLRSAAFLRLAQLRRKKKHQGAQESDTCGLWNGLVEGNGKIVNAYGGRPVDKVDFCLAGYRTTPRPDQLGRNSIRPADG